MKKSLLILSALFFAKLLSAQETLTGSYTELYLGSQWEPYDSTAIMVDWENRVTENISKRYSHGSWGLMYRQVNSYNQDAVVESTVEYKYESGQWVKQSAIFYEYNPDKTLHLERTAIWDTSKWKDIMLKEYFYNPKNIADSSILFFIDESGNQHPSKKTVYGYNHREVLVYLLNQNLTSSGWIDAESFDYQYNSEDQLAGVLRVGITGGKSTKLDSTSYEYTEPGNLKKVEKKNLQAGIPVERTIYQYSILMHPGTISEKVRMKGHAFPNPFNDKLTVMFDQPAGEQFSFTLYDLSGRELKNITGIANGRVELDRKGLESGVYFYKIQSDRTIISGQVIAN